MAIDPEMYKKYSGRSGDPYERLGAALAQNDARKHQREAELSKSPTQRHLESKAKMNAGVWVFLGLIAVIAAIAALFR